MSIFILGWDNTAILASPNALSVRASHRRKDVGGSYSTTGYTPANDMPKTEVSASSPNLLDNVVYEFKIETICNTGGPTINTNGIQEQINFACIDPTINTTDVASTISIDVTGLNITKATFTLRRTAGDSIAYGPVTVVASMNAITATATGLTPSTSYYWQVELIAVIEGSEVVSSNEIYLAAPCGPYTTSSDAPATCVAPGDLLVSPNPS